MAFTELLENPEINLQNNEYTQPSLRQNAFSNSPGKGMFFLWNGLLYNFVYNSFAQKDAPSWDNQTEALRAQTSGLRWKYTFFKIHF